MIYKDTPSRYAHWAIDSLPILMDLIRLPQGEVW